MNTFNNSPSATRTRRSWVPPTVTPVGKISEVLQAGGGKLSLVGGDSGESRKEKGGGA